MITPGAILIQKGTPLPSCLRRENESDSSAWTALRGTLDPHQLEQDLATAGWTFFYMAGEIRMTAFGFDNEKMVSAALRRVIASVKFQECNSLEIDKVETHSFLGMPYVSVSAHCRHIQKGMVFSGATT